MRPIIKAIGKTFDAKHTYIYLYILFNFRLNYMFILFILINKKLLIYITFF